MTAIVAKKSILLFNTFKEKVCSPIKLAKASLAIVGGTALALFATHSPMGAAISTYLVGGSLLVDNFSVFLDERRESITRTGIKVVTGGALTIAGAVAIVYYTLG